MTLKINLDPPQSTWTQWAMAPIVSTFATLATSVIHTEKCDPRAELKRLQTLYRGYEKLFSSLEALSKTSKISFSLPKKLNLTNWDSILESNYKYIREAIGQSIKQLNLIHDNVNRANFVSSLRESYNHHIKIYNELIFVVQKTDLDVRHTLSSLPYLQLINEPLSESEAREYFDNLFEKERLLGERIGFLKDQQIHILLQHKINKENWERLRTFQLNVSTPDARLRDLQKVVSEKKLLIGIGSSLLALV